MTQVAERSGGPSSGRGRGARRAASPSPGRADGDMHEPVNEVRLVGRVAATPEQRELPSGDLIVVWRVNVGRPPPPRRVPEGVRLSTVDSLDCTAWAAGARRSARALVAGDVVEVQGAVRKRFFRAGGATASRVEVEVASVRRLRSPSAA